MRRLTQAYVFDIDNHPVTGLPEPGPLPPKGKIKMDWPSAVALLGFFALIGFVVWAVTR